MVDTKGGRRFLKSGANMPTFLRFLLVKITNRCILGWFFVFFLQNMPYSVLGVPEIECQFGVEVHDGHFAVHMRRGLAYPLMAELGGFFHFFIFFVKQKPRQKVDKTSTKGGRAAFSIQHSAFSIQFSAFSIQHSVFLMSDG